MAEFLEEDCIAYLGRELNLREYAPISEMCLIKRDYSIVCYMSALFRHYIESS